MCAGCVQSGLEFAAGCSAAVTAGASTVAGRVLDRFGLRRDPAPVRRARREAEVAAFLEGLDLDPHEVLGWPAVPVRVDGPGALQPA
ncbi:MAG: hypothetical protein ABIS47_10430 [Acidimicrobiales bacterium]